MRCASAASAASPHHLTDQLADKIAGLWSRNGYHAIADAIVDQVAEHIRRAGVSPAMDPRLAVAIADAISAHAEREYSPAEAPGQMTIDDVVGRGCLACRDARRTAERGWCSACDGAWPIDDRAVSL